MIKWILTSLVVLVVCGLVIAGCVPPTKWEYKSFSALGTGNEAALNKLGEEGWELVGYSVAKRSAGEANDYSHYVFKRIKRNRTEWKLWK